MAAAALLPAACGCDTRKTWSIADLAAAGGSRRRAAPSSPLCSLASERTTRASMKSVLNRAKSVLNRATPERTPRPAAPSAADDQEADGLLLRVLDAALSDGAVERLCRAEAVGDAQLQELGGLLFVHLFRDSSTHEADSVGSRLRSTRALLSLLHLLPIMPPELSGFYLSSIRALVMRSEANAEFACAAGAAGVLLRWLPRLLREGGGGSDAAAPRPLSADGAWGTDERVRRPWRRLPMPKRAAPYCPRELRSGWRGTAAPR